MKRFLEGERKVSWMELFFDLVFIAGAHNIAVLLKDATGLAIFQILFFFIAILLIWLNHTLFTSRFEGQSWFYNIFTFIKMAGVLIIVTQIPVAFTSAIEVVSLCYALVRIMLVLMYIFAFLTQPSRVSSLFATVFFDTLIAGLWLASAQVANPWAFWIAAVLIDLLTPLALQKILNRVAVHQTHMPERFGLFTVIMLGEMIISMVISATEQTFTPDLGIILISGLFIIAMIFWTYFRFVERCIVGSMKNPIAYGFSHLPLFLSLVLLATGFKEIISHNELGFYAPLGFVLYLLSFRLLKIIYDERWHKRQLLLLLIIIPFLFTYNILTAITAFNIAIISIGFGAYLFISEILFYRYEKKEREFTPTKGKEKIDFNF